MVLKEEYGELELDEYDIDTQNPNPKGEDNQDWVGESPKSIMDKKLVIGPGKTITTKIIE